MVVVVKEKVNVHVCKLQKLQGKDIKKNKSVDDEICTRNCCVITTKTWDTRLHRMNHYDASKQLTRNYF